MVYWYSDIISNISLKPVLIYEYTTHIILLIISSNLVEYRNGWQNQNSSVKIYVSDLQILHVHMSTNYGSERNYHLDQDSNNDPEKYSWTGHLGEERLLVFTT